MSVGEDGAGKRGGPPAEGTDALAPWEVELPSGRASWSPGCRALVGVDLPPIARPAPLLDLLHPDDRERVSRQVARALDPAGAGVLAAECRLGGGPRRIAVWARTLFAEVGGVRRAVRLLGTVEDVTARRDGEQTLRDREELFRSLVDNISQLAWLGDRQGEPFWCNQSWYEYTGVGVAELRGDGWCSMIHPAHAAGAVAGIRRAMERDEAWEETLPLRGRDGGYRWFLVRASPLRDDQGRIVRWLATGTDVTAAREEHAALLESQLRLRSMMENATGIVWLKDLAGRFVVINRYLEQVLGLPREEVEGRTVFDLFPHDLAQEYADNDRRVLETGEAITVEESARLADGDHTFVSVKFPLRDSAGVLSGVGAICTDITSRKEIEGERERLLEALREADQRKNHFLAVLSHELRNPLASIRNSVYVLQSTAPEAERARRAREVIDRQSRQLVRMVDDLLDVTRITLGRVTLRAESVELNALVDEVATDHLPSFERAGVALQVHAAPRPVHVRGDRTRLAQILGNLLNNAARLVPSGGHATVAVEAAAADAVVRVHDDGPGLTAETLAHLFQPFSQSAATVAAGHRGLGLGLSLVKTLAELHGGSVTAESPGAGRGATFTVRLPLETAAAVVAPPPVAALPATPGASRRVLIIEDDRDVAETLSDVLQDCGHEVATATSGTAGIELARTLDPDVVLCDLGMPGMDGYAVARAIRADPALQAIYLVALSGHSLPDHVERSRQAGFARHVAKPPDVATLKELLEGIPPRSARR